MTEQISLPRPMFSSPEESEWEFYTQDEDGYVNLEGDDLAFNLARYSRQHDALLRFAEGSVSVEFAEQFGLALLAAVKTAREKKD